MYRLLARRMPLAALLVAPCLLAAGGCANWDPFGPGFRDEYSGWSKGLRPAASTALPMGVDGRSREIERNLGVR